MKTINELKKEIKEIEDFAKAGGYYDKEDRLSEIEKQDMLNLRFLMIELQAKEEVFKVIDKVEVFEVRQDLEQEGVEYPLIDKEELKQKIQGRKTKLESKK